MIIILKLYELIITSIIDFTEISTKMAGLIPLFIAEEDECFLILSFAIFYTLLVSWYWLVERTFEGFNPFMARSESLWTSYAR